MNGWQELDPVSARATLTQDPEMVLLDVRTEGEYAQYRIAGARLLPIQELEARLGELSPEARYLVTCEHGMRSVAACEFLSAKGFARVTNLRGGVANWAQQGLPLESTPAPGQPATGGACGIARPKAKGVLGGLRSFFGLDPERQAKPG
jgi:adenylyltransferase/sulfurtransferase